MASSRQAFSLVAVCLLCSLLHSDAACCTMGQPTYVGKQLNFQGLPTCSDGPCSGQGFDYRGPGVSESADPDSCCDVEGESAFFYNPPAKSDQTWPGIANFPQTFEGTGKTCNKEAPRYRCVLGGKENRRMTHRHLLAQ